MRLMTQENFLNDLFAPFNSQFAGLSSTKSTFSPPTDFGETDTHVWFAVDLPGVAKENIKIEFVKDELHISGERKGRGNFHRAFTLNVPVDSDKIEATHKDGVLTVNVPKSEAAKPRLIEIKSIN